MERCGEVRRLAKERWQRCGEVRQTTRMRTQNINQNGAWSPNQDTTRSQHTPPPPILFLISATCTQLHHQMHSVQSVAHIIHTPDHARDATCTRQLHSLPVDVELLEEVEVLLDVEVGVVVVLSHWAL